MTTTGGSPGPVLVLNSGSSSVKFALLRPATGERLLGGIGERLDDPGAVLRIRRYPGLQTEERLPGATHQDVIARVLEHVAGHPVLGPATGSCTAASGSPRRS